MRALFSLLFGAGMFIFLDRLKRKVLASRLLIFTLDVYYGCFFLGLIHAYLLLWYGEILFSYALMGFLVYSFRNMAPKKLIFIALILFSIGTVWNYADYKSDVKMIENLELVEQFKSEGKALTDELEEATEQWEDLQKERSPEAIAEYNSNMQKNYFGVVAFLAPQNFNFHKYYLFRYDVWDILSMMLLGIAFF